MLRTRANRLVRDLPPIAAINYAQSRHISITTVYTHLRRTREKTGWKSVAELTRRFNELNVVLRPN